MSVVLLVDDNRSLARFTAMNLESSIPQLEVVVASTCSQARRIADSKPPAVLVVDRLLPDGDGLELQADLLGQFPKMAVIIVSADAHDITCDGAVRRVFEKPYDAEELCQAVMQALAGPTRAALSPHADRPTTPSRHRLINCLSTLLASLRYFEGELRSHVDEPRTIERLLDEHVDQLSAEIRRAATLISDDEA